MKIYKHLWQEIITLENFKLAYKNAVKGKKHYKECKNAYISTSGEILVEAGKQFTPASFPFSTIIVIDDKGYYRFT